MVQTTKRIAGMAGVTGGVLLAAALSASTLTAETYRPVTSTYETVKVAEGIYAFIAPEPRTGLVNGNAAVIIGDEGVLVVDSGQFPSLTRRMIAEIRTLTDKPVRILVNTHWHWDHLNGNTVYRKEFPGITVLSHASTRRLIEQKVPTMIQAHVDAYQKFLESKEKLLQQGQQKDGTPLSPQDKEYLVAEISDLHDVEPEWQQVKYEPPDMTYEGSVSVFLGKREVKVMHLGRGNTAGDTVVYVPDNKVLVTGDLVVYPTPYAIGSYFGEWIQTPRKLEAIDASVIVPGHGPIMRDRSYIETLISLLEAVLAQAKQAVGEGLSLEDFRSKVEVESFRRQLAGDNLYRLRAFRAFFLQPGLQRAYEEARGSLSEE